VSGASGDVEKGNITGGEVKAGERGGEAFGEAFGEALAAVASDAAFPAEYAAPGVPGVVGGDDAGRNIPAAFSQERRPAVEGVPAADGVFTANGAVSTAMRLPWASSGPVRLPLPASEEAVAAVAAAAAAAAARPTARFLRNASGVSTTGVRISTTAGAGAVARSIVSTVTFRPPTCGEGWLAQIPMNTLQDEYQRRRDDSSARQSNRTSEIMRLSVKWARA
jgi:hypothetical protein